MDSAATSIDFAAIGHQDSWQAISGFINGLRSNLEIMPVEKIKDVYSFIPPRDLFRINVKSITGAEINGVFIETFIDPDNLTANFIKTNITKVNGAARHAQRLGAGIVALGGFTSIVLEGNVDTLSANGTKFTTGNTLTAAFIVKGIERAAALRHLVIENSSILIIGATGDIGLACTNYFKPRAKKLLLCARNQNRLAILAAKLSGEKKSVAYSNDLNDLLPHADIIISVASSGSISLANSKPGVLICDAGYPKNLAHGLTETKDVNTFHGGMGVIKCGYQFNPDYSDNFYRYAVPYVVHGCLLEAMVLAFEKKHESYSAGKGNISEQKMEEIYSLSMSHGITLAPFFNSHGLWPQQHH